MKENRKLMRMRTKKNWWGWERKWWRGFQLLFFHLRRESHQKDFETYQRWYCWCQLFFFSLLLVLLIVKWLMALVSVCHRFHKYRFFVPFIILHSITQYFRVLLFLVSLITMSRSLFVRGHMKKLTHTKTYEWTSVIVTSSFPVI